MNSTDIGRTGEGIAAKFLSDAGYTILERNWHDGNLEIDIIAYTPDKTQIVFVEVKTKWYTEKRNISLFVDRKKQKFMINAMTHFRSKRNIEATPRYDIITVEVSPEKIDLKHIHPAFFHVEDK